MKSAFAVALVVVSLVGGCATRQEREVLRFDGDYGPLTLDVDWPGGRFAGDYPAYEGRMSGTALRAPDGGAVLSGTWTQPRADRRCAFERDGRRTWGRFVLLREPAKPPEAFWGYCEDPPGNAWPLSAVR